MISIETLNENALHGKWFKFDKAGALWNIFVINEGNTWWILLVDEVDLYI